MARELTPDEDNLLIELGRLLSEESYSRERKEIEIGNLKLDLLKRGRGSVVVGEVKKSSRFLKSAEMQLLFYLYKLKERGIQASGELLIPREKKRMKVELTRGKEKEIEQAIGKIEEIISREEPPLPEKCRFCPKCAYREFCWA
jgi:CRISPR-associated exonuclease Cas4